MCGFFSIIFNEDKKELGEILTRAGYRLSYRGYDTVGIGYVTKGGNFEIRKSPGKIHKVEKELNFREVKGYKGTIQLRWATYGRPSFENAQPHFDCKKSLIGAHNGNIVNSPFLREELISRGHNFLGENDGETLVHVIEENFRSSNSMGKAILSAFRQMRGDYAFSITKIDEERFFAVKKGSSLFLGVGENFIAVSSDSDN